MQIKAIKIVAKMKDGQVITGFMCRPEDKLPKAGHKGSIELFDGKNFNAGTSVNSEEVSSFSYEAILEEPKQEPAPESKAEVEEE